MELPFVKENWAKIELMGTTSEQTYIDMWDVTNRNVPMPIRQFKELFLETYAALPSNTQLAESTIKDGNFCQISGWTET